MKKNAWQVAYIMFAALVLAFSLVMATKILPYFSFEHAKDFLGTKTDEVIDKPAFIIAFYVHISSSIFALVSGVFQFSTFLLQRKPKIHQILGKIYVFSILALAAPSGLIIALDANGGLTCKVAFFLQSLVWWVLTYWAWDAIMKQLFLSHTQWMLRSFALTLAAMSLRTESYGLYYFAHTKPIETYQTVTWLSWVGNLLLIEMFIYYGLGKRLIAKTKTAHTAVIDEMG
jgi:uncharacterized membrane protein